MRFVLSEPLWISKEAQRFNIPDLEYPVRVENCLTCNESFVLQDPLWVARSDLMSVDYHFVIHNVYFDFSEEAYLFGNMDRMKWIVNDSHPIVAKWLDKLRSDVEKRENLYELFHDIHTKKFAWPFYNEEEFYDILSTYFDFLLVFWKSVCDAMLKAKVANSDKKLEERWHTFNHLLDNMKHTRSPLWLYKDSELKDWEIAPYERSFKYEWRKVILRNNWNMTPERIQEVRDMKRIRNLRSQLAHEEKTKRERIKAEAFKAEHGYWPLDYNLPF